MDAMTIGHPLTEQPASGGKHPNKKEDAKGSFEALLQSYFAPSESKGNEPDYMPNDHKKPVMEMFQNGNVERKERGEERVLSFTYDQVADADLLDANLLEIVKAMVTEIVGEGVDPGDLPITLDQEQLQSVFNRLTMLNEQEEEQDNNDIEAIIAAFLRGMEEASGTAAEKVQKNDGWFGSLQTETEDISESDVLDLLEGLLDNADTAEVKPEQLLDLTNLMAVLEVHHPEPLQKTIAAQAQRMIAEVSSPTDVDEAAKPLLKLLETWSELEAEQHYKQPDSDSPEGQKSTMKQEQAIWQKLTRMDEQKNPVMRNKQPPAETKTMDQKVKEILLNAQKDIDTDRRPVSAPQTLSAMPMSKAEQFVIHLQQQANNQTVDQQLMDQFQKAVKTSTFLTGRNGTSQLHIALKPESLGDMMIKLTQENGEMTVKIMVSAQAAKDMLESNIHQLKHLFSPNQVVIEKQDMNTADAQGFKEDQDGQPMQEQDKENHDSQQENNRRDKQQEVHDSSFHEWLMNEKV